MIQEDVKKDGNKPLLPGKNKVLGMMTDFGFVQWRPKMYAYITKDKKKMEDKHCKDTKNFLIGESLNFHDYKTCIFDTETINKEQMALELESIKSTE